jgi:hypothetical protein
MGAACCKNSVDGTAGAGGGRPAGASNRSIIGAAAATPGDPAVDGTKKSDGTVRVLFDRLDREKKGYIDEKNLKHLLRDDDRSFFQGRDVSHILAKYGSDNRLTYEQFQGWWSSTYTTYEDLELGALVEEVTAEQKRLKKASDVRPMEPLDEETTMHMPVDAMEPPLNSNLVVSRS